MKLRELQQKLENPDQVRVYQNGKAVYTERKDGSRCIKLRELEQYLENSDRVQIYRNGKAVYTGFWWFFVNENAMYETARESDVIRFRATQEVRHRNWMKDGLSRPLNPDGTADYYFRDLQVTLHYKIYITDDAQPCTA